MARATKDTVYTTLVYHKALAEGISSIDAYAQRMREVADWLAELAADGVAFAPGTKVDNGHAWLQTTDAAVAARHRLERGAIDEDDDDGEWPDDEERDDPAVPVPAAASPPARPLVEVTLDDADPEDLARGPYVGILSHHWFADGIDTIADYVERWREHAREAAAMAADGVRFVRGAVVEHASVDVLTTLLDVARRYRFVTQRQMYGESDGDEEFQL